MSNPTKKTSEIMDDVEKLGNQGFDDGKLYYWVTKWQEDICINDYPELKAKLDKIVKAYFQKMQSPKGA